MTNASSAQGLSPAPPAPLLCLLGEDAAAVRLSLTALASQGFSLVVCGHGLDTVAREFPVTLVSLPTPLGRTIGRSWLVAQPLVQAAAWVVFLDAGLVPPADWLGLLFEAVAAFPEARSWGCRETAERPGRLAIAALQPPDPGRLETAAFALAPVPGEAPCGPCLTMPGGCRLFRGDRLQEDGGWNLAFSPEHHADTERDLALALRHGRPACVCQERLVIPAAPFGSDPRPNACKLAYRFAPGELETLATLSRTCHTALSDEEPPCM